VKRETSKRAEIPGLGILIFDSAVADADAEGEGEGLNVREAGGFHHLLHGFSGDEGVDGLGEIFVGAGFVAADPGGGAGEDFGEVEVNFLSVNHFLQPAPPSPRPAPYIYAPADSRDSTAA
jgi:hypothetical protein